MKQRYSENFLFPQGAEDYGVSLVFPQGQLHGLGDAKTDGLIQSRNFAQDQANSIKLRVEELQKNIPYLQFPSIYTLQQAVDFLRMQNLYFAGMNAALIAATVHDYDKHIYVDDPATGYGYGYGNQQTVKKLYDDTIKEINDLNVTYQSLLAEVQNINDLISGKGLYAPRQAVTTAADSKLPSFQTIADAVAKVKSMSTVARAAAAASTVVLSTPPVQVQIPQTIVTPPPKAPDQFTNYVVDFDGVEFTMKDSTGRKIGGGIANHKTVDIFIAPFHVAMANVTVTPAAAAKFAANSAAPATTGTVATSTGVTTTGTPISVTTNQTTGTTTVTSTATGVTATTTPDTGTTTVGTTSGINTGNIALIGLLGFLLLRGAIK